ncbi:putative ankyrin repeat protein [Colletotrichum siamense]|uniref:Ankyrin repeat protein n=1 Tax=Colletotrichum siamense TaxID=690259 RepID=A0A9P5F2G6_COLSI|nr:putative ankyrin repeat protein [Colletotrichum siamense]KAF4866154.1 putative ankyrin repeat protein [Colletotrichum siamense]
MSVYRVIGLPTGLSKASTKEILDELFGTETQTIVRSLGLYPHADYLVAIVMFFPVPSPLLKGRSWKFDKVLSFEGRVRRVRVEIDTTFLGFTPLNVVEDTHDSRIDCVVVSDFGSHSFESWKDGGGQFMWLVDDDAAFPPNVRVLLYGYDTSLRGSESSQNLTEIGDQLAISVRSVRPLSNTPTRSKPRPIAFIAHGLGGLVVKEAIYSLAKKDDFTAKSVCGLVFFGVPHQGLLVKLWLRLIKEQPSRQLVENLKPGSPYLKRLDKSFKDAITFKGLKIISIVEEMNTQNSQKNSSGAVGRTGDGEMLVSLSSALGHWSESVSLGPVAIKRSHENLPKFRSRFDEDYQTFKHCLLDMWATAIEDVQRRFAADKKPTDSNIPLVEERLREAFSEKDLPVGLIPIWPDPQNENATDIPTDVDLIAIHGVGGHAVKTWTCGDRFWLQDFLPLDFPRARVLTFGFDGSVVFNASKSSIANIAAQLLSGIQQLRKSRAEAAERKLIFVCHGIGGMVFKQAMIMACESESRYSGLGKSVAGVIFLGTPHKKADMGYWSDLLKKTAFLCGHQQTLLPSFEERAIELGLICSRFEEHGMPAGLQVFSLFEQQMTESLRSAVVDKSSAILHLPAETLLSLNADHDNMSRHLTRSSHNYSTVFNCIAELIDTMSGKPEYTFFNSLQLSFILNLRTKDTERDLSVLPVHVNKSSKWLLEHPDFKLWTTQQGRRITWLHGPPGSGKTILMRGVVAHLMEQSESSGDIVIRKPLYFFFDDKDSTRKTSAAFVRSVLSQILVDKRISYLIKYLEGRNYREDAEVEDNLWICLSTVIEKSRGIVFQFVIDAIDEVLRSSSEDTTTIFGRLKHLITQDLSGRVKLILSHREMPQNEFLETDLAIIDADNDSNWQNVQAFVSRQIRRRATKSQISDSTKHTVENKIMEISRGNFLHARLAWDQFSKGVTNWSRHQISKSLDQLSTISHGLVAAYCNLLSGIPRAHQSKARASFVILRISKEKLTSRQLAFFATLYTQRLDKRPSLWSELQPQSDEFEKYLAEACGYLITRAEDGLVDFSHISAKDLFTGMKGLSPEEQQVLSTFVVSEADAHAMMHTLCMSIFQLENREADFWREGIKDVRQAQKRLRSSFATSWISREQLDEVADLGATHVQSFARTPCFAYALRHYISHYEAATSSSHADSALVTFMATRQAYYCHSMWLAIRKKSKDSHLDRTISVHLEPEEQGTSSAIAKSAALFRILARGDCPQIVKGLVAEGANVNHAAGSGDESVTPLSWAIVCGRKHSFCALLRNENIQINYGPRGSRSPLHQAVRYVGDVFYAQRLIDHPHINVNVPYASATPLHEALDWGNRPGVDALLAHPDIDLGIQDSYSETPYLKAFKHKMWGPSLSRIMTMVPQGTFSMPILGTSQLLAAGRHGWTDVEEIFLRVFPDQVLTQNPDTKMHVLAHYAFLGCREKLLWIMDRLPNQRVSLRSEVDRYDLLHLCANQNWEDIVHMIQRKYRLQSLSSDHVGRTLLHWAAEYNWDIDKMDLSQYSRAGIINNKDRDGLTVVHIAVTNRNITALEILVASGASYLQKDNAGMSPAHMAADQGYRAALDFFIGIHHADFGITRTGASLLHLIAPWANGAMIHRFVTSRKAAININFVDRDRRTALHYAAIANNASAVEELVTLGCNINGRDNNGKSPIHEAIRGGGAETALLLLRLGADWRATDAFGQTCLHLSLRYNSEILASRFLRLGMDIGSVDRFGMTPLHRACGAGNAGYARELLHRGAAWDARNMYGRSPLELAVEARAKRTVETVVSWLLTLRRAQISGTRRRIRRYLDSALMLACELELDSTGIGSILKQAGADIDYSQVKVERVYLVGPTAEKRDPLVPRGLGLHNPFDSPFKSGPLG